MLLGYARVSKADGSQSLDLQMDALAKAGVTRENTYEDHVSGAKADRPGLSACFKAARAGDTIVTWKLDRLGRNLKDLLERVAELERRGIHFKVIAGHGADIDTSTPSGRLIFQIFAALAEFERAQISERTKAGLAAARARGRNGGRPPALTPAKLKIARAAMADPNRNVSELCKQLGVSRSTLYKYVGPNGEDRT